MRAVDGIQVINQAPGTYTGNLQGGMYCLDTLSTGAGSINVNQLALDGVTYNACGVTAVTTTSGFQTAIYLPPGEYEIVIAGFTANYVSLMRVPIE